MFSIPPGRDVLSSVKKEKAVTKVAIVKEMLPCLRPFKVRIESSVRLQLSKALISFGVGNSLGGVHGSVIISGILARICQFCESNDLKFIRVERHVV